ncbi:proline-rich membrane anchor 1 [Microcaecilia unicolor]|uniref:Proline-rich membrane anchor 1 n=1 Tax=Microcaecilia unicolor TaxID=1415580 RepID=A0A6P7Z207_9AMPH|nr:proline-rich membrane anchor 1 [Microcaecilia unicolor]
MKGSARTARGVMLIRALLLLPRSPRPSLLLHWALLPLWALTQITQGELQNSCSRSTTEKGRGGCQQVCCRPPPPLPPPPPPPLPPRPKVLQPLCPTEDTRWQDLVIIIAVCCASLGFLFVLVIICYKAIKRQSRVQQSD